MYKKRKHIILLLCFLPNLLCLSQNIPNGYFCDKCYRMAYVYNDTIIFSYGTGTVGTLILKGVLDHKKWINFIPIKNKLKSSYKIVKKEKSDSVSVLRFNMYSLGGTMFSNIFDGRYRKSAGFGNEVGCGLGCTLAYTTAGTSIEEHTSLIFNGNFLEISLPSNLFESASLTIHGGGQYVTVPILKDSLLTVDVFQAPSVFYPDNQKRMKYRYSEETGCLEIKFNYRYRNGWEKFFKSEQPCPDYYQWAIEHHINEMKGGGEI